MKTKILVILAFIGLNTLNSSAQLPEVVKWLKLHPEVEAISQERWDSFNDQQTAFFKTRPLIIFQNEITIADINAYAAKKGISGITNEKSNVTDAVIKDWVKNHPDVKIIRNSELRKMSAEKIEFYQECSQCLILSGDEITLDDINRFGL